MISDWERIKRMFAIDETRRGDCYDDETGQTLRKLGHPTIGCGRNLDARPLSEDEIDYILQNDVIRARDAVINGVSKQTYLELSPTRRLALINLAFTVGKEGFKKFARMIAAIQVNDFERAGVELKNSVWWFQVDRKQRIGAGRDDRVFEMLVNDRFPY